MKSALLLGALLLAAATAHAEAPMVTEHTDPLAVGECEWELFAERQRADGARASAWSTNAGCGLVKNVDLGLGIGRWRGAGERIDALELYGRWRLREGGDDAASVALVYGLEGLKTPGRSWRHDTSTVQLAVDQPLGGWGLARLNLGLQHSRIERASTRLWALGLEVPVAEGVTLVGETYGQQHERPWRGLGLRWQPLDGWSFGAMVSRTRGQRAALLSAQWIY